MLLPIHPELGQFIFFKEIFHKNSKAKLYIYNALIIIINIFCTMCTL